MSTTVTSQPAGPYGDTFTQAFTETLCMACSDETCDFKPLQMGRRAIGPRDVLIDSKYPQILL